jgi:hypothetical protein
LQHVENVFDDRRCVSRHVIVPNSDDMPSMSLQPRRTPSVCFAIGMLAAIHLNDQALAYRSEVGDVRPDWPLTTKFVSGQTTVAQRQP